MKQVIKIRTSKRIEEYFDITIFAGTTNAHEQNALANCGTLCMREKEYRFFLSVLVKGTQGSSVKDEDLIIFET